jgi:indolepyruvate ferredoxin oxidoreductase beta subunit
MTKNFNIIIKGVGGQGIVTLVAIIDQAAFLDGYDIKSSELHGLSQREGSVEAHIKFGKKVFSPLVYHGQADLIIGQELLEGLRSVALAGSHTKFLVNTYFLPFIGSMKKEEIMAELNKLPKDKLELVDASKICIEKLGKDVVASVYLLGYAIKNNLIPLEKASVIKAIEKVIPQKYQELNKGALNLA